MASDWRRQPHRHNLHAHRSSSPAPPTSTPSVQPTPTAKQAHGPLCVHGDQRYLLTRLQRQRRPAATTGQQRHGHGGTLSWTTHELLVWDSVNDWPDWRRRPHRHNLHPTHLQPRPVNPAIPVRMALRSRTTLAMKVMSVPARPRRTRPGRSPAKASPGSPSPLPAVTV